MRYEKKQMVDSRKVAIYSRKSKFTGKGESIDNQIEICKRRIASAMFDGINIDLENDIVIYEDEGFTGANTKRPQFQKLMQDIKDKKIRGIVFYRLDRISRDVKDFSDILRTLNDYNVFLMSATENIETATPSGKAMAYMTSVFAQLERDTIAERIRDNMLELAKTGRWLGGDTPTGFTSEAVGFIDDEGKKRKLFKLDQLENEMQTIDLLFEKMDELPGISAMQTYSQKEGIKTKNGCNYNRTSLMRIFNNPVYVIADKDIYNYYKKLGANVYGKEEDYNGEYGIMPYNRTAKKGGTGEVIYKDISEWVIAVGKHQGRITGKQFIAIQEKLIRNADKRYRKPLSNKSLLSGLLRCSHCGSFMRPKMKQVFDEDGRKRFYYMCELKDTSRKAQCQCKNINGLEADDEVMKVVKELVSPKSKFYATIKELANPEFKTIDADIKKIRMLEDRYRMNEKDIETLANRITFVDVGAIGDITKQITKKRENNTKIEQDLKELRGNTPNEICDQETARVMLDILNNYYSIFDTLETPAQRDLIRILIASAESDGEELTINLIGARNDKSINKIPCGTDSNS